MLEQKVPESKLVPWMFWISWKFIGYGCTYKVNSMSNRKKQHMASTL